MAKEQVQRRILFMISGSIAAFKACAVISKLKQQGHEVQVVASTAALRFIGPATLEGLSGNPLMADLWQSGHAMDHIHAVRWADLIVAAPASAHFINRIAQGVGDDLLTTMFLAHDFKKPFLIAPAMNTAMYLHPATQKSLTQLRQWGIEILEAASGVLACGEQGFGRLLEPDQLLAELEGALARLPATTERLTPSTNSMAQSIPQSIPRNAETAGVNAPRVLVTAGGTIAPIDDVRFIANESTGQTGVDIANALYELGADVTILAANNTPPSQPGVHRHLFRTYDDLSTLMRQQLSQHSYSHVLHAAAVSDYSVARVVQGSFEVSSGKIPSGSPLTVELKPNPKIISLIRPWSQNKNVVLVGFKLTSQLNDEQIQEKVKALFQQSQCDYVVQNDRSGLERELDRHSYNVFSPNLEIAAQGKRRAELTQDVTKIVFQSFAPATQKQEAP